MINAILGICAAPFNAKFPELLPQQREIFDILTIHADMGGFCVIVGDPGVGKTVLRVHIENLQQSSPCIVVSCSRTLHTYNNVLQQLGEALKINVSTTKLERALIDTTFKHASERKKLYTLIDEAHQLDIQVLRKLRLLFERFPKNHALIMFGQTELLRTLSMNHNLDIKSRITYSVNLCPLNDLDLDQYIQRELDAVALGANTFDPGAKKLIVRHAEGNLRLCRNLCLSSLIEACRESKKIVSITHVNNILVQPHWRNHEQLIAQQVDQLNQTQPEITLPG